MSNIAFIIGSQKLHCSREILISKSQYFSDLLTEFNNISVVDSYSMVDPKIFSRFLKWLNGKKKISTRIDKAFQLFRLLDQFLVKDFDLSEQLDKFQTTGISLLSISKELQHFYQGEFPNKILNKMAKFYRQREDLSSLDNKLVSAIKSMPLCRIYPNDICDLLYSLEDIAFGEFQLHVVHDYVVSVDEYTGKVHKIFKAYGLADLTLQLYDNYVPIYEQHSKNNTFNPIKQWNIINKLPFDETMLLETVAVSATEEIIVFENCSTVLKDYDTFGRIDNVTIGPKDNVISSSEYFDEYNKQILINRLICPDKYIVYLDNVFVGLAKQRNNYVILTHLSKDYVFNWEEDLTNDNPQGISTKRKHTILDKFSTELNELRKHQNVLARDMFLLSEYYEDTIGYILNQYKILRVN